MIVQRTHGLLRLLWFTQAGLMTLLFWGTFIVFSLAVAPGTMIFTAHYAVYWAFVLGGLGLEILTRGSDQLIAPIYESSLVRQLPVASRQVGFALGGLLVFLALAKDDTISRTFLTSFAVLLYGMLLWSNATLPLRLARLLFAEERDLATLLVGPASRVGMLDYWLKRKRQFGMRIVGVVSIDPAAPAETTSVPTLGSMAEFDEICNTSEISQVILLELCPQEITRTLLAKCQQRGMRLLIVNDLAEQIHHPIRCVVDEGINLVTLHEEPLENPLNRVMKRAFDLALAASVVVCVLPWLIVLVWVCQRLQSPGPLWHRQKRAGLQNRPFTILKFRTMHPGNGDETLQAKRGDARIYPLGRWLRRLSLDEIPQFLNVLGGEMSVAGPRPHLVEHNTQFAEVVGKYHLRTFIKPGITGLAQVRGFRGEARTTEDIAVRLQSDLIYLENWSLALDFGIVLRTAWQMFRPPPTAV